MLCLSLSSPHAGQGRWEPCEALEIAPGCAAWEGLATQILLLGTMSIRAAGMPRATVSGATPGSCWMALPYNGIWPTPKTGLGKLGIPLPIGDCRSSVPDIRGTSPITAQPRCHGLCWHWETPGTALPRPTLQGSRAHGGSSCLQWGSCGVLQHPSDLPDPTDCASPSALLIPGDRTCV